jgi:hypothetical protein
MTLPKVDVPIYELTIPSTGQAIKVRPFIVREEKLLMMALASNDENQIIETTKQVVNNCILTDGINVEKLPFFDVDYLFIALRAKSVGEAIDVNFICNHKPDGTNKCGFVFPVKIDIANVSVTNNRAKENINLSDNLIATMKYPSYATMRRLINKDSNLERKIGLVAACIDLMVDEKQTYSPKDYSKEEFEEFLENLTETQFKRLEEFVDNMPTFFVTAQHECPKCSFNHRIEYKDFTSFFR